MPKSAGRPRGRQSSHRPAAPADAITPVASETPVHYDRRFLIVASATCAAALLAFFRDFVSSGFNMIAADIGDGRLAIAILEHWWAVVRHQAPLASPNFFWPEHGVLGYSDSLFLFALPYSFGRALGLDRYLAFESALVTVQTIAFASTVWLLRSFLRVSSGVALVGAVLFAAGNVGYRSVGAGHVQLLAVAFCPLVVALGLESGRLWTLGRRVRCYLSAVACGVLVGLLLFTSFYIGWFTVLFAAVIAGAWLALAMLRDGAKRAVMRCVGATRNGWGPWAAGIAGFILALIPFLLTYLPVLRTTGGRTFADAFGFMAAPIDTINVGPRNLVWGTALEPAFAAIRARHAEYEHQVGWPPVILIVAGGTVIWGLGGLRRKAAAHFRGRRRFAALVSILSAWLLWLASLNIRGQSYWRLIFAFVPGAAGIRVPERIALVLNVAVIAVAAVALEELRPKRRGCRSAAFWCLAGFLIVEQVNLVDTHMIDRKAEREIFAKILKPPADCRAFFLSRAASDGRPFYANQIDAMLVARQTGLPTINGYSGWVPAGWLLNDLDSAYHGHVKDWVVGKNISHGLCSLNLRAGSWEGID